MGEIVAWNVSETRRPASEELEDEFSTSTIDLCNEAVDIVRRMNAYVDPSSDEERLGRKRSSQTAARKQHLLLARAVVLVRIISGRIALTGTELAGKTDAYVALASLPLENSQCIHLLAVSLGRDGQRFAAGAGNDEDSDHQEANWSSQRNRFICRLDKEE